MTKKLFENKLEARIKVGNSWFMTAESEKMEAKEQASVIKVTVLTGPQNQWVNETI